MSVNRVFLLGHLGKDPESKQIGTGSVVCNLSLATSKKVNGADKTEWHRVTCWNKTAEFAAKYLTKGRLVFVEGELQTRSWEQDGQRRYMTEVVASRIEAVGPRGDSKRDDGEGAPVNPGSADAFNAEVAGVPDDDLPF
jgi:single-strand DNA-binding protein